MKTIVLDPDLMEKSIRIGAEKARINDREGMRHKQYFRQRMAREGNHALFWHTRGTLAEAAVLQYLRNISQHFSLPEPVWTGGFAWTRKEREANAGCADITWLGVEVEVKGMETFDRPIGINRADCVKGRTQVLSIVEVKTWQEFERRGQVWTPNVSLTGVLSLARYWKHLPDRGGRVWDTLPVPKYDNTQGFVCRQVPQSDKQDLAAWARGVVAGSSDREIRQAGDERRALKNLLSVPTEQHQDFSVERLMEDYEAFSDLRVREKFL